MSNSHSGTFDSSTLDVGGHALEIHSQGYTIIPDVLTTEQVQQAVAAMEEVYERERPIAERFGEQTPNQKVVRNILGKHQFFESFYLCPPVVAVCRQVLGEDMVLYDTTARSILPGGGREQRFGFHVHVDRETFTVEPFKGGTHLPVALNVLWALVDFSDENGATLIWPETQRSLEVPDPSEDYPGFVRALMAAGSVVMWDAATWHASGRNHSDHDRHSAIGFYQRSWVRGMINNEHHFLTGGTGTTVAGHAPFARPGRVATGLLIRPQTFSAAGRRSDSRGTRGYRFGKLLNGSIRAGPSHQNSANLAGKEYSFRDARTESWKPRER